MEKGSPFSINNTNEHIMPTNRTDSVGFPASKIDPANCRNNRVSLVDDPDLLEVLSLYQGAMEGESDCDISTTDSTNSSISLKSFDHNKSQGSSNSLMVHLRPKNTDDLQEMHHGTKTSLAARHHSIKHSKMFTNIVELPSTSSASLHGGNEQIAIPELSTKSNSVPILLKNEKDRFTRQLLVSPLFLFLDTDMDLKYTFQC